MKEEYNFSNAKPNPYINKKLIKQDKIAIVMSVFLVIVIIAAVFIARGLFTNDYKYETTNSKYQYQIEIDINNNLFTISRKQWIVGFADSFWIDDGSDSVVLNKKLLTDIRYLLDNNQGRRSGLQDELYFVLYQAVVTKEIKADSISYDQTNAMLLFEYSDGSNGGIMFRSFADQMN